ncbi:MAG: quinol monooxygenase YgiN [Bradymonadia bacterium]|jgi:quinol monooxygenase YgiN
MILTFHVKPEARNEFLGALKDALPDTRAYDGCESVTLFTPDDDEGRVMIYEQWATKEKQAVYFNWRVETGLLDAIGPMLSGEPETLWLTEHPWG